MLNYLPLDSNSIYPTAFDSHGTDSSESITRLTFCFLTNHTVRKHLIMSETFTMVYVIRNNDTENYTIRGLPEGKEMNPENYTEITASYLSVNGIGFSCEGAEFSQYNETITVEQKAEGCSANIILPDT